MGLLRRAFSKPVKGLPGSGYQEYSVDPHGVREGHTAGAVIIDGAGYTLQGEPAPYPATVTGFKGNRPALTVRPVSVAL